MAIWPVHRERAYHNQSLAAHLGMLSKSPFPDWEVTALFYAAVHLVDAFLDYHFGINPRGHSYHQPSKQPGRNDLVKSRKHRLRPIYNPYRHLYDLSIDARYDPEIAITPLRVQHALQHLMSIRAHVAGHLPW